MKKQAGFTLIELVIVIIILGILAVTAAPKFLNLQDDAKEAAAQGVQAAVSSSAQMVYSKSALEGEERSSLSAVDSSDGGSINTVFGYPKADNSGIGSAVSIDASWKGSETAKDSKMYQFIAENNKVADAVCVLYTEATDPANAGAKPATTVLGKLDAAATTCVP